MKDESEMEQSAIQNQNDMDKVCKPSVIGCVLGTLQSGFLHQIQSYQKNNNVTISPCVNYPSEQLQNNQSNNQYNNISNPPSNDNWNPWPEGSTY